MFFLGKCVRTAAKTMVVKKKKPEGTSSAIFEIGTAAKYCKLKRCADPVRSTEPTTKMKSLKVTWAFCFPKKTTEYSVELFLSIYSHLIFFLKFLTSLLSNWIVLLNKLFKKPLFQKLQWSCDFPPKKRFPKARRDFPPRKKRHSSPPSGCLATPLTLPQSLYGVRWRHNQNFSDR